MLQRGMDLPGALLRDQFRSCRPVDGPVHAPPQDSAEFAAFATVSAITCVMPSWIRSNRYGTPGSLSSGNMDRTKRSSSDPIRQISFHAQDVQLRPAAFGDRGL
jgi:hypothetical protein